MADLASPPAAAPPHTAAATGTSRACVTPPSPTEGWRSVDVKAEYLHWGFYPLITVRRECWFWPHISSSHHTHG